jgi:hypothetical protein
MHLYLKCFVEDCVLDPRSGQTKSNNLGICYFTSKHTALNRAENDWYVIKLMGPNGATKLKIVHLGLNNNHPITDSLDMNNRVYIYYFTP